MYDGSRLDSEEMQGLLLVKLYQAASFSLHQNQFHYNFQPFFKTFTTVNMDFKFCINGLSTNCS